MCTAVSPEALQSALAKDGVKLDIGFGSGDSSSNFGAPCFASTCLRLLGYVCPQDCGTLIQVYTTAYLCDMPASSQGGQIEEC